MGTEPPNLSASFLNTQAPADALNPGIFGVDAKAYKFNVAAATQPAYKS